MGKDAKYKRRRRGLLKTKKKMKDEKERTRRGRLRFEVKHVCSRIIIH